MAGDDKDIVRGASGENLRHRALDRADVGDDGSSPIVRRGQRGGLGNGHRRGCKDHQICTLDGLGNIVCDQIGDPQGHHTLAHDGAEVIDRDRPRRAIGAHSPNQRRANQAAADDSDAFELRSSHGPTPLGVHKIGQCLDQGPVMLFQTDGDAQIERQPIACHAANEKPA